MSFLSVEKISAGYGGHPILADVSFQLEQGCMMGILGANGCGKTTLLKTICGILPHKGTCLLEQAVLEQLSARRMARLVGYIPQRSGISIDISVLDVVLMSFNPRLGRWNVREEKCRTWLHRRWSRWDWVEESRATTFA